MNGPRPWFVRACRCIPGPLLWHFENNNTNDPSIELDLEEVKALARQMGFRLSVSLFLSACLFPSMQRVYGARTSGRSKRVIRATINLCSDIYTRQRFGKRPRCQLSKLSEDYMEGESVDRPYTFACLMIPKVFSTRLVAAATRQRGEGVKEGMRLGRRRSRQQYCSSLDCIRYHRHSAECGKALL